MVLQKIPKGQLDASIAGALFIDAGRAAERAQDASG